jgi:two-component system, cell cycle response regulator DivK
VAKILSYLIISAVPKPPSDYKVLLVEDHPLNVELVRDLLEAEGLVVLHSNTAEEALAIAGHEQPDLMLIDLALPGMDGLEATRLLKEDPATRGICVVVLTARAMKGDREMAMAKGCDAYMTKPLDTRTFTREILTLLRARGAPRRRQRSAGPDGASGPRGE